jgi:hypothetical protein
MRNGKPPPCFTATKRIELQSIWRPAVAAEKSVLIKRTIIDIPGQRIVVSADGGLAGSVIARFSSCGVSGMRSREARHHRPRRVKLVYGR